MPANQKKLKIPPKRFQPKGAPILHEDHDIIVINKASGLLTISTDKVKENTAYFLLNTYIKKGNQKSQNQIFIVHRLDRDTSGVLVFAKSEKAKHFLQAEWQGFTKKYFAVVHGILPEKEGMITNYLAENHVHKVYSIHDPAKGKLAKTGYKVLKESKNYSLLEIDLITGRKNQIRAHFSELGFPVVGDKSYGDKEKDRGISRLALHSASLTLIHPHSKEEMVFETKIPDYFKALINGKVSR